jgi:hypothetical protein
MRFISKALLLAVMILLSSCMKTMEFSHVQFDHSIAEMEALKADCKEISNEGSLLHLLSSLKDSHDEILNLVGRPNPIQEEYRVRELANSIKETGERITSLVKPDWTTTMWAQTIAWNLDQKEFKNVKVHSVYSMGQEVKMYHDEILLHKDGGKIIITLNHVGSSLEICQLQKTFLIMLEVQVKNIHWVKKKFLGLTINNSTVGIYE